MMVAGLLVAAVLAAPAPPAAAISEIRGLLSLIESAPDYQRIRARPQARAILELLYADPAVPGPIQGRALFAIATFKDDAAFARVAAVAADPTAGTFRGEALRALAVNFGDRALPLIEQALAAPVPLQVKRMAAISLKDVGSRDALALALTALGGEVSEPLKADLARSIRHLETRVR